MDLADVHRESLKLEGERLKAEINLDDKEHGLAIISVVLKTEVTDTVDLTESKLQQGQDMQKFNAAVRFVCMWRDMYMMEGINFSMGDNSKPKKKTK